MNNAMGGGTAVQYLMKENQMLKEEIAALKASNAISFDEIKIGTWVDGKPLYRKAIHSALDGVSQTTQINLLNPNTELINAHFVISSGGGTYFANVYISQNEYLRVYYTQLNGRFIIIRSGAFLEYKNIVIIAEYTKTTD